MQSLLTQRRTSRTRRIARAHKGQRYQADTARVHRDVDDHDVDQDEYGTVVRAGQSAAH